MSANVGHGWMSCYPGHESTVCQSPPSTQLQERVKASLLTTMGEISAGTGKGEEAAAEEMIELKMMARNAPGQEVEMRGPGKEQ